MGSIEGKRVQPSGGRPGKGKVVLIVVIVVLLALLAGYVGLCAWAGGNTFLPHTTIAGVDVGGQTREQAADTLEQGVAEKLPQMSVKFTCEGKEYTVPGGEFTVQTEDAVGAAAAQQNTSFFLRGVRYLSGLIGGQQYSASVSLNGTPKAVEEAVQACADQEAQTTWTFENNELVFHKGITGRTIDVESLSAALEERMGQKLSGTDSEEETTIEAQVTTAPPVDPDFAAIKSEICVPAADAYLDADTYEIVPSVTGVDFDETEAKTLVDAAEEGTDVTVPVTLTQPKITTEDLKANLFKDVLGTGSTKCSSPSERWYNIDLAASRVNGTVLMPGEVFSYNDHCGPYTVSSGYKKAGTYQNGQSIDATAGGICQLSSTIYWVTLKANLEIVERNKHAFNGGYMPVIGTDATVWSDQLDFRFKNNTDYPIKIETYQDKSHYLHVTIYGTDTTGIHGEPYSVTVSTVPYKNTYQPKDSIPVGSAPQRDTNFPRYNGVTVDVYQKLVDKNGKTVDTIFLYRNTYKSSDAVYYYNPADAARLGINTSTGLMTETPVTSTPKPSATATPTPTVTPTPTPTATPTPAATPTPTATPSATPSTAPTATPTPPAATTTVGPGMEPVDESPAA